MRIHVDSVNMTQLYKEDKTEHQKLERHYAVARPDSKDKKKHWTEQIHLYDMYCHLKLPFLKIVEKYQSM